MRDYKVFYHTVNLLGHKVGKELCLTIKAISGWAAKFVAVRDHNVHPKAITRVV